MEELDSLYALLVTAAWADSIQILNYKDTIQDSLQLVVDAYNQEWSIFENTRDSLLELIKIDNAALTVDSLPAINEKSINDLELKYHLSGYSLSSGDLPDVYDIAIQCPLTGGRAVFRARSLHDIASHEYINWDSLENCPAYELRKARPEIAVKELLKVYPNPTDGTFTIELLNKADIPVRINLFDMNGKKLMEQAVNGNPFQLDGSHLPQGIYSLQILLDNNQTLYGRVVILH